jgi:hypothetical protein
MQADESLKSWGCEEEGFGNAEWGMGNVEFGIYENK